MLIITVILVVLLQISGIIYARKIARKLTEKIVSIYLTLDFVIKKSTKKQGFELTFKPSNKELNELQKTFNRVARSINLATASMQNLKT